MRVRSFRVDALLGGGDSASSVVGGLMLVNSYGSPPLRAGEGYSDSDVALLPRDCGRDESKEADEELVGSGGVRRPDRGPAVGEAVGSTMTGFAF